MQMQACQNFLKHETGGCMPGIFHITLNIDIVVCHFCLTVWTFHFYSA